MILVVAPPPPPNFNFVPTPLPYIINSNIISNETVCHVNLSYRSHTYPLMKRQLLRRKAQTLHQQYT